jgi:hypothetical protein
MTALFVIGISVAVLNATTVPSAAADTPWRELEPGLELACFSTVDTVERVDGDLLVLRVDLEHWDIELLTSLAGADARRRTPRDWCREHRLVAAINAGMYMADGLTHVGYLACDGRPLNPHPNHYLSAASFRPRREDRPRFRIFDLDETPLEGVTEDYLCVVQNLRLVKRPGEPRWYRRDRAWRETALGEDGAGRALLIACGTPLTMPDLIGLLLALPLDLRAAQHLEGGAEAQLYIAHPAAHGVGGKVRERWIEWPVPSVLGVVSRRAAGVESDSKGPPR